MEKKERIREVEKGIANGEKESFVTGSYMKQLELNKEQQMLAEVEEQLNEKKTANAKTGMMGFYKNFMNKNIDGQDTNNELTKT